MISRVLKIVQYIALLALMLVAGVFWGNWFSFSRSFEVFDASELTHIAKAIVANLAVPMRFISIGCILMMSASAVLIVKKRSAEFYLTILSLALICIALALTVAIEVPINNKIISWTPSSLPPDWETIRNHWQSVNVIRMCAAVLSFVFFGAAVVKPFQGKGPI